MTLFFFLDVLEDLLSYDIKVSSCGIEKSNAHYYRGLCKREPGRKTRTVPSSLSRGRLISSCNSISSYSLGTEIMTATVRLHSRGIETSLTQKCLNIVPEFVTSLFSHSSGFSGSVNRTRALFIS
jgi:hypothetical protein